MVEFAGGSKIFMISLIILMNLMVTITLKTFFKGCDDFGNI